MQQTKKVPNSQQNFEKVIKSRLKKLMRDIQKITKGSFVPFKGDIDGSNPYSVRFVIENDDGKVIDMSLSRVEPFPHQLNSEANTIGFVGQVKAVANTFISFLSWEELSNVCTIDFIVSDEMPTEVVVEPAKANPGEFDVHVFNL